MKISKMGQSLTLITTLLVGISTSGTALGHGGGWNGGPRVGVYIGAPIGFNYGYSPYSYYRAPYYGAPYYGAPYYGAPYYGAPYYYPPAPVYYPPVQPAPVIYTERSESPQISPQTAPRTSSQDVQESWWYYCVDAKAYYPYVKQCPGGWLRVAPQPAPGANSQPALNNAPPAHVQ